MKKKVALLTSITIFIFSVILVMQSIKPVNADPRIISVPDDYEKIQWAVGNASAGDTILVAAGTYREQVTVNKPLTLIGENPSATIIDGFLGTEKHAIKCLKTSNVNISGFTIRNGIHGIDLDHSANVTISGNTITNNSQFGIFLVFSSNNTIHNNTVSNNGDRGIYLRNHSSNNIVSNNTISNHREWGIYLFNHSSKNVVSSNTILYSGDRGIYQINADNNVFIGNTISNNIYGMSIRTSAGNTLKNNKIAGNRYNFDISAVALGQYIHDIDPSNTVNGKPMYYWVNQVDKQVPAGAGYVAIINSKNITVKDQTLTNNTQGVLIAYTTNSTIVNVNASYNNIGIHIVEGLYIPPKSGNNVIKNNILANNYEGIEFRFSSDNIFTGNTVTKNYYGVNSAFCNNTFYHNNFIDNINLTYRNVSLSIINIWDNGYPSGGNYWSDYTARGGYDNNGDGIGDVPYVIDDKNKDNYPLMAPIILVDQILTSDDRCNVGSLQNVSIHAVWPHNSSNVVEGSVYVNGTKHVTDDTGWIIFNATYDTVGKRVWTVDRAGGLISCYIIWDRVQIALSNSRVNINSNASIVTAVYEYDGAGYDGIVTLNDTFPKSEVGRYGYTAQSISGDSYNITFFESNSAWVIFDRVNITLSITNDHIDVESNASITWYGIYEYDGSTFSGSLTLNDTQTLYGIVGRRGYTTFSISDPLYGLTAFTSNSVYCIWDAVKIVEGGVSKTQTNINRKETVWFKAVYEYDNVAFDGTKGTLYVNDSTMTWSSANNRWEQTYSFNTTGTRTFQVSGVSDSLYALTVINNAVGAQSITWMAPFWMQWWFWTAIGAGTIAVIAICLLKVRKTVKKQN